MDINAVSAPGFNEHIRGTLKNWSLDEITEVQRLALEAGVADGKSQIVCAPTSSGKTLIGEIAILVGLKRGQRCLYLVSHKALADQKYDDFLHRYSTNASGEIITVGLSTGDRDEGDVAPQLMVATYEKALALLLSGQVSLHDCIVIADELQILGEEGRGANIETLCTIFKQRGVAQFIGLTATVGNPEDLADWLQCSLVLSHQRAVELHQEIWAGRSAYRVTFGQEEGERVRAGEFLQSDPVEAARYLALQGQGPVLVFTESRAEAVGYATRYSQRQPQTAPGVALAAQLELFSEPTDSSEQLQAAARKRVAFHSADLSPQERQVVEEGLAKGEFDVCFATSTLIAGVNFPFRSVVFGNLTYQFGDRQGNLLTRSDYRNASGRAGRLGMHPQGYAILLPKSDRELKHANKLVLPENDRVASKLVSLSMRRCVLSLISSQVVTRRGEVNAFLENTLFWHQLLERNPKQLEDVSSKAASAVDWLLQHKLIEEDGSFIFPTPVGKAIAQSGLLPSTAVKFLEMLQARGTAIQADFENHVCGLIHWACSCDEFKSERAPRFLPFIKGGTTSGGVLASNALLHPLDRTDFQGCQCSHALLLFSQGEQERIIRRHTNISSGHLHRLAGEVAWIFDGLRRIMSVPELGYPQTLTNRMSLLARQIQWGAPVEAIDMIRLAHRERVPGFGRQRAMALLHQGIQTFDQLLVTAQEKLTTLLGHQSRVRSLLQAVGSCFALGSDKFQKIHSEIAAKLGLTEIVDACTTDLGENYERAIMKLLKAEKSWDVRLLDDGKLQNVVDILVVLSNTSVLIECKTTTKKPPVIKKEEAFAVMQKAADFEPSAKRVTLGKPAFDEHSKGKVLAATSVSLVEHNVFMEGMLRVLLREVTPKQFLDWLGEPGLTELDRLPGRPSYQLIIDQPEQQAA